MLISRIVRNKNFLRGLSLTCGTLAMAVGGSIYTFNTFANAAKATFNLTQTQVELLGSLINFGVCTAFPAGFQQEKLGPAATLLTGIFIACAVFILLWNSVSVAQFYHRNFFLLAIYFFLTGFGSNFPYIAALDSNIRSFPRQHRGKVVALLDASFSTGPFIIAAVYGAFFVNGHITDEQNQDLGGFFLFFSIIFGAISIIAIFTVGIYPVSPTSGVDGESDKTLPGPSSGEIEPCLNAGVQETDETRPLLNVTQPLAAEENSITGLKLLKDPTFHLLTWPLILSAGVQLMFFNNIGIYLKSFNYESHTTAMAMTNFASDTVAKLTIGTLSDYLIHQYPRATFILAANILQSICMFVCIFGANNLIFLYVTTVFVSISNGCFWCLSPTIASEYFGTKYIGRNWGLMLFCTGIPGWVLQVIYGELYSAAIEIPGATYCYGLQCFAWSFVMGFALSFVSVLMTSILLYEVYIGNIPRNYAST